MTDRFEEELKEQQDKRDAFHREMKRRREPVSGGSYHTVTLRMLEEKGREERK